jgi:cysteine desulfurase
VSIHRHRIYLDHNATSPLVEPARIAMAAALDAGGNPSSVHREGRRARHVVETARDQVAALLGVARDDVVFTSGGTEADRLGLAALAGAGAPIARPPIEHPAVLGAAGPDALDLAVDAAGRVDLAGVDRALAAGARVIAVAAVNHELGTVQDLAAIAARTRAAGARLFVDAVQAAGKLALAPITALADAVAISAHKLGGPAGVGAVWVRPGLDATWPTAGHQEKGRRGGTENVAGIAGFGAATAAVLAPAARPWAEVAALGAALEAGLIGQGAHIHGAGAPRVGGTVNAGWDGVLGESIVIGLDLAGVAASTGAACTSGTIEPSPVLLALGLPAAEARRAVRFSLGRTTTRDEVDRVLAILPGLVDTARRARA